MSSLLARVRDVAFADGTTADVELHVSQSPADDARTFAAMVFVRDAAGDFALVHSIRRQQWGAPGGWREGREPVPHNAVREVEEETGIRLDADDLQPCGFERFMPHGPGGLWPPGQDLLQAYRADLDVTAPPLSARLDDTSAREWVSFAEFERRCADQFWWPLAAAVFSADGPARG